MMQKLFNEIRGTATTAVWNTFTGISLPSFPFRGIYTATLVSHHQGGSIVKIIFKFSDEQVLPIEVQGEIRDFYLELAGISPENAPDELNLDMLEKHIGRKHVRTHKYTGIPVSYESIFEHGEQVADHTDVFNKIELDLDLSQALKVLTDIQRRCFIDVCIIGKTQRDVAKELKKSKTVVSQAINGARKKLKNFFKSI